MWVLKLFWIAQDPYKSTNISEKVIPTCKTVKWQNGMTQSEEKGFFSEGMQKDLILIKKSVSSIVFRKKINLTLAVIVIKTS